MSSLPSRELGEQDFIAVNSSHHFLSLSICLKYVRDNCFSGCDWLKCRTNRLLYISFPPTVKKNLCILLQSKYGGSLMPNLYSIINESEYLQVLVAKHRADQVKTCLLYVSSHFKRRSRENNNSNIFCSGQFIVHMYKIPSKVLNMSFLHKYVSLATETSQNKQVSQFGAAEFS